MVGKEEWKEIRDYEGRYMVSNFGNVISCERYVKVCGGGKRLVREKKLKQSKCPGGYSVVNLWKDNSRKMFLVHRLVAEAFLENKNKLPEVNHKDENKENNSVDNLEWCTSKHNANYGTRNKRMVEKKKSKPVVMLGRDGEEIKKFRSLGDASREMNVDISAIIRVCKGKQKTCLGYKWAYACEF